ncbi:tRNA pseudouridine(38-40) synthase TruA [bacterium]|nr:tRNA pseudouridine(38-40) synthase TruA [bacterium]
MPRVLKILIEYDGTQFAGWQVQPGQRTIQGEIESALFKLTGESIRIVASGRTDAGVHATAQAASFNTESLLETDVFVRGLNGSLPFDIRILSAEEMYEGFNARFDAVRRIYRYTLSKRSQAIGRHYAWYPRCNYDLSLMKEAAKSLIGEHDFQTFAKSGDVNDDYHSIVYRIDWQETDSSVIFEIEAIRYFHNMIRIIIGTLIDVGRGRMSVEEFTALLDSKDRRKAGITAPAHGLNLYKIIY